MGGGGERSPMEADGGGERSPMEAVGGGKYEDGGGVAPGSIKNHHWSCTIDPDSDTYSAGMRCR